MTEIFIVDIRTLPYYDESWICNERRAALGHLKHENVKRRSLAAELALIKAVRRFYPKSPLPVKYRRNEHGKPYLCDYPQLKINISHSGSYAVCAASDREVGIDIQRIKTPYPGITERFFTADEQAYIGEDTLRFYEIWSKKESYLKAKGTGMTVPLNSFSVLGRTDCEFSELSPPEDGYVMWTCTL